MEILEELYKKLEIYSDFQYEQNCENFIDTINEISLKENLSSVPILLKYLDDKAPVYVMESLMIILENYGPLYVKQLLINIEYLYLKANFWLKGLIYGILNNQYYLSYMMEIIDSYLDEKLINFLKDIQKESPTNQNTIKLIIKR